MSPLARLLDRCATDLETRYQFLTRPKRTLADWGVDTGTRKLTVMDSGPERRVVPLPPRNWNGPIPEDENQPLGRLLRLACTDLELRYRLLIEPKTVCREHRVDPGAEEVVFVDSTEEHTIIILPPLRPAPAPQSAP